MSVFIPRASGTPEVSPCRGPGATLRLVDDVFVVLGPGTGPAFETLDMPYDLRQVPPSPCRCTRTAGMAKQK